MPSSEFDQQTGVLREALLQGIRFVCSVFWGPDLELCTAMQRGDVPPVGKGAFPRKAVASLAKKADAIVRTVCAYPDAETLLQDLDQQYITLFVSSIGGVAAPLYHSCYVDAENGDGLLMGRPAVSMNSRLSSAGLKLDETLHQMPDHLCVELEYLYFLLNDDGGQQGGRIAEAESFVNDEMLPWVEAFQRRLAGADKDGFYNLAALLLVELLTLITVETF